MRRSACVPLPTPGAPTSMIRAARLNSFIAIELDKDVSGAESGVVLACSERRGEKAGSCSWQREARGFSSTWLQPHVDRGEVCTIVQMIDGSCNGPRG